MEKFVDCQSKKMTCMIFKALGEVALYFHLKYDLGPGLQSFLKVKVTLTLREVILHYDN